MWPPNTNITGNDIRQIASWVRRTTADRSLDIALFHLLLACCIAFLPPLLPVFNRQLMHVPLFFAVLLIGIIDDRRYPNGMPFAPTDLISPTVLQTVYKDNKLNELGISNSEFRNAVSILPYAPNHDLIVSRYSARLSDRKLSFVERQQIEREMMEQLQNAQQGKALLRLTLTDRFGIPDDLGNKIITDIAKTWATYSIESLGVLDLPNTKSGNSLINLEVLESSDPVMASYILEESIETIVELTNKLKVLGPSAGTSEAFPNIVDEKSRHTPRSLIREITNYQRYQIAKLRNQALLFGNRQNDQTTKAVLQDRLLELQTAQDVETRKAKALEAAIQTYHAQKGSKLAAGNVTSGDAGRAGSDISPQLSSDFIDRLITLSNNPVDLEFRQTLTSKQMKHWENALDMEAKLALLKRLIERLSNPKQGISGAAGQGDNVNTVALKKSLLAAAGNIDNYWKITQRLYQAVGEKRLDYQSRLYVQQSLKSSLQSSAVHPILNRRVIVIYLAGVVAISILSLLTALVFYILFFRKTSHAIRS